MTKPRRGTASRLGIRQPCSCRAIPQKVMLGAATHQEMDQWFKAMQALPTGSFFSLRAVGGRWENRPMTEPSPPTFEVGKRAYWIHESWGPFGNRHGLPPIRNVRTGVVMSTGPAVTQVWDDNGSDPVKHHALTLANDKVWPDIESAREIIKRHAHEDREMLNRAAAELGMPPLPPLASE